MRPAALWSAAIRRGAQLHPTAGAIAHAHPTRPRRTTATSAPAPAGAGAARHGQAPGGAGGGGACGAGWRPRLQDCPWMHVGPGALRAAARHGATGMVRPALARAWLATGRGSVCVRQSAAGPSFGQRAGARGALQHGQGARRLSRCHASHALAFTPQALTKAYHVMGGSPGERLTSAPACFPPHQPCSGATRPAATCVCRGASPPATHARAACRPGTDERVPPHAPPSPACGRPRRQRCDTGEKRTRAAGRQCCPRGR